MDDQVDYGAKLGKIRRGEKVLIPVLAENLQDRYTDVMKDRHEVKQLIEAIKLYANGPSDVKDDDAESMIRKFHSAEVKSKDFWLAVNEQYKLWKVPGIAIRNGYCIVALPNPEEKINKIKKFMEELADDLGIDLEGEEI